MSKSGGGKPVDVKTPGGKPPRTEAEVAKLPVARPGDLEATPGGPRLRPVADPGAGEQPAPPVPMPPPRRIKTSSPAAANLIARVRATAGQGPFDDIEASDPEPAAKATPSAAVAPAATVASAPTPAAKPTEVATAATAPASAPPKPRPAGQGATVIDVRNLSLTFVTKDGPVEALSGIDLAVGRGEFVSLIGPSGCGKTTLLRIIADLERPTAGSISVNGVTPEEARLRRAYGYVFQAPALYPWRNIARNVALPLEIMGLPRAERERRVAENLALVNLTGFERKYPWQLSGGMQQRVSIARALSVQPDLMLMDEPFGALDEIVRDHLNEQLLQLWAKTDKTVVFVTHSIPEAVFLSTRIIVMSPRPGRVHDVIASTLPRERTLDIRETPEFLAIAHRVRMGLRAGHSYED